MTVGCMSVVGSVLRWSMTWGWRIFSPIWLAVALAMAVMTGGSPGVAGLFWSVASVLAWGVWLVGWSRRRRAVRAEIEWLAAFDYDVIPVIADFAESWPHVVYHVGLTSSDRRDPGLTQAEIATNLLAGGDPARRRGDLAAAMAGDAATRVTPRWAGLEPTLGGFRVEAELIPGQRPEDWTARAGALAAAWAVESVSVGVIRPGVVEVRAIARDPLAEVRDVSDLPLPVADGQVVGRREDGSDFEIDLARGGGHAVIQGMTGSGKSSTTYVVLSQLADRSDVEVWGIDPTGLLLGPWEGRPGSRVVGTADLDEVVAATAEAVAAMEGRITRLLTLGVDLLAVTPEVPAIHFVVEEFPGLMAALATADKGLKPGDRREAVVRGNIGRLLMEGRKVGLRVLLLAQRADASIIGGAERSNIAWRVTHRVDKSEAVRMLHETADAEVAARIARFEPGDAWVEGPGVPPQRIRADYLDYQGYVGRVRGLR